MLASSLVFGPNGVGPPAIRTALEGSERLDVVRLLECVVCWTVEWSKALNATDKGYFGAVPVLLHELRLH